MQPRALDEPPWASPATRGKREIWPWEESLEAGFLQSLEAKSVEFGKQRARGKADILLGDWRLQLRALAFVDREPTSPGAPCVLVHILQFQSQLRLSNIPWLKVVLYSEAHIDKL